MRCRSMICSLLIVLPTLLLYSQTCRVINAQGEGVPYTNIHNGALQHGLVSDANGYFQVPEGLSSGTELRLSCLGYRDTIIETGKLQSATPCLIRLNPEAYELPSAEISEPAYKWRSRRLGISTRLPLNQYGFVGNKTPHSFEFGLLLENDQICYLKKAGFVRSQVLNDSTLLEFKLYRAEAGQPGKPLHHTRLLRWISAEEGKRVEVDLETANIRVDTSFVIALQTLKGKGLLLNAKRRRNPPTFIKRADGQWIVETEMPPALYAELRCR